VGERPLFSIQLARAISEDKAVKAATSSIAKSGGHLAQAIANLDVDDATRAELIGAVQQTLVAVGGLFKAGMAAGVKAAAPAQQPIIVQLQAPPGGLELNLHRAEPQSVEITRDEQGRVSGARST
jgi:hypothetical protein